MPAAQRSISIVDVASNSMGSPESDDQRSPRATTPEQQRGSINADGSVNLGFRRRSVDNGNQMTLLPEPPSMMRSQSGRPQHPSSAPMAYTSTSSLQAPYPQPVVSSLTDENRLPPLTSYSSTDQRRPSLSPNSFLSPSRKRSFSAAETEASNPPQTINTTSLPPPDSGSKRLSSIKSILNPAQQGSPTQTDASNLDPILRAPKPSPPPTQYANMPSPAPSQGTSPDTMNETDRHRERAKLERRAELQREAERMRELLKAKERELEELGDA